MLERNRAGKVKFFPALFLLTKNMGVVGRLCQTRAFLNWRFTETPSKPRKAHRASLRRRRAYAYSYDDSHSGYGNLYGYSYVNTNCDCTADRRH